MENPTVIAVCTQMKQSVISCEKPREPELIETDKTCHQCAIITSSASSLKFSQLTAEEVSVIEGPYSRVKFAPHLSESEVEVRVRNPNKEKNLICNWH